MHTLSAHVKCEYIAVKLLAFQEKLFRIAEEGESHTQPWEWSSDHRRAIWAIFDEQEVMSKGEGNGKYNILRKSSKRNGRNEGEDQLMCPISQVREHRFPLYEDRYRQGGERVSNN